VATNVFELVGIYIRILSSLSHHDDDCNTGASTSTTRTTNHVLTNIDMADSTKETTVLRDLNRSRTKHQQIFDINEPLDGILFDVSEESLSSILFEISRVFCCALM